MTKPRFLAAAALLVLLGLAAAVAWHFSRASTRDSDLVDHTHRVTELSKDVLIQLVDAETGQRGYLLTGRDPYLATFMAASPRIGASISQLRSQTADNPAQQERLNRLAKLVEAKLAELRRTIELRRTAGLEPALAIVNSDQGKGTMDEIRNVLADMQTEEAGQLSRRLAARGAAASRVILASVSAALLALVALIYGAALIRRAEREVSASAVRLRATLENIPQGVLLSDREGRIEEWNQQFCDLLAITRPLRRDDDIS